MSNPTTETLEPSVGRAVAGSAAGLRLWTNDVETFVAETRDDLARAYEEHYGDTMEDMTGDPEEINEWREIPADEVVTIFWPLDDLKDKSLPEAAESWRLDETRNADWSHKIRASASAWADFNGRGFLCSTEW